MTRNMFGRKFSKNDRNEFGYMLIKLDRPAHIGAIERSVSKEDCSSIRTICSPSNILSLKIEFIYVTHYTII